MKKLYVIAIILGAILTPMAHKAATSYRGYTAIGGEILLIPLFMLLILAADQAKEVMAEFKEVFNEEEEEWTK